MRPEPVFEQPWHAQVFALTVHLNEAGHFAWSTWADAFGATLASEGFERELNGGDDYFQAWLKTLEQFLGNQELANANEISRAKQAWTQAYLQTPHGEPVQVTE